MRVIHRREHARERKSRRGPARHTFIYHPAAARDAIVERARTMLATGSARSDVVDQVAKLRVQITRYRHMPAARVYELGSRIAG